MSRPDAIYVATSAHDGRFTRICVASIRAVYPNVPVRLLLGGPVSTSRLRELADVWDALPAAHVTPGNYGWGFVKLEPLFGPPGERFLVLDSDTVLLGPVLDGLPDAPFVVDRETQTEADTARLYYDWRKTGDAGPPAFVFNSGQWVGTSGILARTDFEPHVQATWPRTLRRPDLFMPGDQGVLNYVLNQAVRRGDTEVAQHQLMRWPGHDMADVTLAGVSQGPMSPHPQVGHWAGFKAARLAALPRADLLLHFERLHYAAHGGERLRQVRAVQDAARFHLRLLGTKARQRIAEGRP